VCFSDGPFEFGCCTLNVPADTLKVLVAKIFADFLFNYYINDDIDDYVVVFSDLILSVRWHKEHLAMIVMFLGMIQKLASLDPKPNFLKTPDGWKEI